MRGAGGNLSLGCREEQLNPLLGQGWVSPVLTPTLKPLETSWGQRKSCSASKQS